MELRSYKRGDEIQIVKLFEKVFGRPMALDFWKWRFENNPAGKYLIKLMWDGDKLVGHYAVSPVKMTIKGKEFLSTLSMTTMTDPEYGGKGIFGNLANSLNKELEMELGVKAIWGFPNNNSHYSFIKNLDWKNLGLISHISVQLTKIKPQLSDKIKQFEVFTLEHEEIMAKITSNFSVYVKRDIEYLTWRYNEKPNTKYYKFEYIENEIKSFIIVKKYPSDNDNQIDNLYITELGINFSNLSLLPIFISHLLAFFKQSGATLNTWLSIFDERYIYLEKIGFYPTGKPTYIGVRANNEEQKTLTDFRNWYYSYGDSDVY